MRRRSADRSEGKVPVRTCVSPMMLLSAVLLAILSAAAAEGRHPEAAPKAAVTALTLSGAPPDVRFLDYLAVDRARHRVWVPASGTGSTVVIDTQTLMMHRIENFPTAQVERRGQKRIIGPTAASVGDGVVYVGNRADSSV